MSLASLRLQNIRCLESAELALHPRLNLVVGANGSGKTSLLEAIYLLGRGRSFRTRYTEQLIRHGQEKCWVAGQVIPIDEGPWGPSSLHAVGAAPGRVVTATSGQGADPDLRGHRLDLRCDRTEGVRGRIDGQPVSSLAVLAQAFAVQIIDPGIHRLLEEGPTRRRRWLDWAVFHVEPAFIEQWQRYGRALRQRNAALSSGADPGPWETELAPLGEQLSASRARVIAGLQPRWAEALQTLGAVEASLEYQRGWSEGEPLAEHLARQRDRDRPFGRTRHGPHRFDVLVRLSGRAAREVVSRGQQKLLGAAMTLALTRYVADAAGAVPTLLLDDPAAELDAHHSRALLDATEALGGQRIVTALQTADLPGTQADRVFHVEQGRVATA